MDMEAQRKELLVRPINRINTILAMAAATLGGKQTLAAFAYMGAELGAQGEAAALVYEHLPTQQQAPTPTTPS